MDPAHDDNNDSPASPARRGLRVRHEAAALAVAVFDATDRMNDGRRGAFADQMRRAAVAINGNLAEGEGRDTARDRLRLFTIAWGELRELDAYVDLADRVGALAPADAAHLASHVRHVGRMLHALRRAVAAKIPSRRTR